jgi:hypothetical protein
MMNSYIAGFEKKAGETSEIVGTLMSAPVDIPVGAAAYLMGGPYSKAEQAKADKAGLSNILLPGVAGYRLGKRILTDKKGYKPENRDFEVNSPASKGS